ncbi:MAG: cysteine desulfurase, partial [Methylobacter sp.]
MNTSNSDFAQQASLPDIEQLTKLANEMFTALPCDGSRIGLAAGGLTSSLPGADRSAIAQGFDLPGEADLQKLVAPRQPSFDSVPDSLDTGSVFGNPSSAAASPLAGLDKSVLEGILPHNFGLPDEAQLQQLLVSRVPSGSGVPGNAEAASLTAGIEPLTKVDTSPQAIEAQLQKLFAANTAATGSLPKSAAGNSSPTAVYGLAASLADFDASLIAGLSPQAYGLPGETELQKLFGSSASIPANAESGSSFYFLDELKTGGFNSKAPALASAHPAFDVHAVRRDFPILKERVNG